MAKGKSIKQKNAYDVGVFKIITKLDFLKPRWADDYKRKRWILEICVLALFVTL